MVSISLLAQKPGYYNGTETKQGEELKAALHEIIKDHIDFSYSDAKYILEYAQEDPANSANLITFYTGVSKKKGSSSWGTGDDNLNREHVWAKSHGAFADIRPMDGDAHNLHAADASVNITRSNYDFDEVDGGTYIAEADAYYASGVFEPSDREKGAVARTLMYMAVRYEGTDGEMDLELEDKTGTYPGSTHGKLSTLLQWNRDFPPTDYERRRNDRVAQCQGNRNPFIDNPYFADLIWADSSVSDVTIGDLSVSPQFPKKSNNVVISAKVLTTLSQFPTSTLFYGKERNADTYNVAFSGQGDVSATLDLASFIEGADVFYKIKTDTGDSICGSFTLDTDDQIVSIAAVQGTGDASPLKDQTVTITGVVTANFDNIFMIQDGDGERDAVPVYSYFRGHIGDSIKVKGKVVEYNNLTEISDVTSVYNYGYVGEKEPIAVSMNEIGEAHEGVLIELKNVMFEEGGNDFPAGSTYPYPTFTVTDGVNDFIFYTRYNSRLNNMPIPNGTINIKGVVSQYKDNYQIMSNDTSWFTEAVDNDPPKIVSVVLEDRNDSYVWMYVNFNEIVNETDVKEEDNFTVTNGVIVKRNYYDSNKPNQAKIIIENIGKGEHTLTVSNIKDAFGNVMPSTDFKFTSDIDKTTALGDQKVIKSSVYPNPITGEYLYINAKAPLKEVKIYSLGGQLLLTHLAQHTTTSVDVSNLKSGVYILHIQTDNEDVIEKITIK